MAADRIAESRARAEAAQADPLFLSDCEGVLRVWHESALMNVVRDDAGRITGWREPYSYRPSDLVFDEEVETWDLGEDEEDDRRRTDITALVTALQEDVPYLLAERDRLAETLRQLNGVIANQGLTDREIVSHALDVLIAHHEAEERIALATEAGA